MSDLAVFLRPLLVVLIVLVLVAALVMVVRRSLERHRSKESDSEENALSASSLLWLLPELFAVGGAVVSGIKYVYREWREAPVGSPARFWWTLLLSAMAAFVAWIMLRLLDRTVNRGSDAVVAIEEPQIGQSMKTEADEGYAS